MQMMCHRCMRATYVILGSIVGSSKQIDSIVYRDKAGDSYPYNMQVFKVGWGEGCFNSIDLLLSTEAPKEL